MIWLIGKRKFPTRNHLERSSSTENEIKGKCVFSRKKLWRMPLADITMKRSWNIEEKYFLLLWILCPTSCSDTFNTKTSEYLWAAESFSLFWERKNTNNDSPIGRNFFTIERRGGMTHTQTQSSNVPAWCFVFKLGANQPK